MRLKKLSLPFLGFLQASGLYIYIYLIASLIANLNKMIGPVDTFLSPVVFLLLFVISAMISASLVLARAGYYFWERRYKEAVILTSWTLFWAIVYLAAVFSFLFATK